jgi:hypothetical protein
VDDVGLSQSAIDGSVLAGSEGRPRRLGDYTLLRELGQGGMGIVYEAEHESLKSRVALKVMHPRLRADRSYLRRFQTEARSAAKLHHTNIVPVFDYGEHEGVFYYAMQCIEGVGLDRVLEDVRRLRAGTTSDLGAASGSAEQCTEFDPVERPPSAISRGLISGRFAGAPAGFPCAGPDLTSTAAIEASAPLAIHGNGASADKAACDPPHANQGWPAARLRAGPTRSISARSRGSVPKLPTRWNTPTGRV